MPLTVRDSKKTFNDCSFLMVNLIVNFKIIIRCTYTFYWKCSTVICLPSPLDCELFEVEIVLYFCISREQLSKFHCVGWINEHSCTLKHCDLQGINILKRHLKQSQQYTFLGFSGEYSLKRDPQISENVLWGTLFIQVSLKLILSFPVISHQSRLFYALIRDLIQFCTLFYDH